MIRIKESLAGIVYHTTGINRIEEILKTNAFYLTTSVGTSSDGLAKGYFYYLSVSRVKYGGYARSLSDRQATIVLDGDKFNQRYKGVDVDYWGSNWRLQNEPNTSIEQRYSAEMRNNENEERLITNDSEIPNAVKYIKEIHICIGDLNVGPDALISLIGKEDKLVDSISRIGRINRAYGIPIYFYDNFSAYKTQFKKKAFMTSLQRSKSYYLAILDLLNAGSLSALPNDYPYDRLKDYLSRGEGKWKELIVSVGNDIHNDRTDPLYRKYIAQFTNEMRKAKCKDLTEFIFYLGKKFEDT